MESNDKMIEQEYENQLYDDEHSDKNDIMI